MSEQIIQKELRIKASSLKRIYKELSYYIAEEVTLRDDLHNKIESNFSEFRINQSVIIFSQSEKLPSRDYRCYFEC